MSFKLFNDVWISYSFTIFSSNNGDSSTILAAHLKVLRKERNTAKEAIVEVDSRKTNNNEKKKMTNDHMKNHGKNLRS